MKRLSQTMVLLTAISFALPMQAVRARQLPNPVSGSATWTSSQMLLAAAVAGAAVLGLCSLYSWYNKPLPEQFTVMNTESRGNARFDDFLVGFQETQAQIDVLLPTDIQHINTAEKFRGVLFGFSKGRYPSEQDAYIVRMNHPSGFIELSCSNIPALSLQIKSALEGLSVRNVRQADIEAFLTRKFNS